jgi:hypothetical protein
MQAYRTYQTLTDPNQLTLTDLPFQAGESVEILILGQDPQPSDLKKLFQTTQALPQIQALTDQDIETEIASYQQSQCES